MQSESKQSALHIILEMICEAFSMRIYRSLGRGLSVDSIQKQEAFPIEKMDKTRTEECLPDEKQQEEKKDINMEMDEKTEEKSEKKMNSVEKNVQID